MSEFVRARRNHAANVRRQPHMRRLMTLRCLATRALITACLIVAGCSTPSAIRSEGRVDWVQLTGFWQPHLLYLLDSPHPRLYVEVDAVEGCAPEDATLNKLRDFLATHCRKPEGIEIARSDVIPIKDARGVPSNALARKFLNGPPENTSHSSPAFLYVLFYDGALCDQTTVAPRGQPGEHRPARWKEKNTKPHVDLLPYPAMIFMNTRYVPSVTKNEALLHEAGHALGLVRRTVHASDYHCLDRNCLMNAAISMSVVRRRLGLKPVKQDQLCQWCEAELAENWGKPPAANLRLIGPVMVRSEDGYNVVSLPDYVGLSVGVQVEEACRNFASLVRNDQQHPEDNNKWKGIWLVKDEMHNEPAKLRDIVNRSKTDPYERVRIVASKLEQALNSEDDTRPFER